MKKYKFIFSLNALLDIEDAVLYYNEQQKNLGRQFAKEVKLTLNIIKNNPYYTSIRYADIRCAVLKTFPNLIHYKIDTDTNSVNVLSVYNTYRKPFW